MARNWLITASLLSLGCSLSSRTPTETAARPSANEHCPAGTRWLATDPHVPLAVSRKGELLEAGVGCCEVFAARGQRWQAVDGWGRVVGVADAAGGERNEATECRELDLKLLEGGPGAVYATPDFGGSPSFAWTPSRSEQASLRELVAHADALLVSDDDEPPLEWTERTRFFSAPAPDSSDSGIEHYAMIGGRALLVARLTASRGWMVSRLDAEMAAAQYASSNAYLPVAVLDMTSDGYPEIIFRENAGPVWGDDVLCRSTPAMAWKRDASSPGGSTI